jgi:PAS domain S-box-containing protein
MENGNMTMEQIIHDLEENCQWLTDLRHVLSRLRQAQEVLKEREAQERAFFSLSDDILFIYNNKLELMSVSPNVERFLGYKPEELIGKNLQALGVIDPKDEYEAFDQAQHMLSVGIVSSSIYQYITKSGDKKFAEVRGVPYIVDGRVAGILCVGKDITERVKTESR